jgi:endonuclease/exonuclease/phosphatase family metal-dependent hydrolase
MHKRLVLSIFRNVLSFFVLLIIALGIFTYWGIGGSLPERIAIPLDQVANPVNWPIPEVLTVASYNIGHGHGIKEHSLDYRDKETVIRQLASVADAMTQMNADVFLLQEVDIDSDRSFRVNQIEFIKARTKHAYHACAMVWEKNYVPYPFWPLSHHLGYVRAANCILSRFPLSNHERIIFNKPASHPFWINWGYIDRGIERADVNIAGHKIALVNIHLEAWDREARELQATVTLDYIKEIKIPVILGGDFNTVPNNAMKTSDFSDDPGVDYTAEKTLNIIEKNGVDIKVAKLNAPDNAANQLFTFRSDSPNRLLDHIYLFGGSLQFVDFRVVSEAGTASDHLPVIAKISYKN